MKIALLSNVTVDLLAGMIKKNNDVYLASGFDTWQQEMIMPASGLYTYKPDAVVVLLHAGAYEWVDITSGCRQIDEWCAVFKSFTDNHLYVPVFISSIDVKGSCQYIAETRIQEYLESYLISKVQEMHQVGIRIYILPVKDLITDLGRKNFYSGKMWYVGSMPYSIKGLNALNDIISRYTSVVKGMRKKCIAVDLDNTLWGGVIGEDGIQGIILSNHKEGQRYYDTQKILKKMKEHGVMLAVLSKNNADDVEPVFKHPQMVLQHDDFVAEVINWKPKSVNIRQLAIDLNIGLDSFVFLDDSPVEREAMKAECPEVAVIEFPTDSSLLPETVEQAYYDYFLSLDVTSEDTKKTTMYRAERQRKAEMSAATSIDDFLKKLEMTIIIHKMLPEEEKRVVQLINKTNQFNVTTKRYSEEEIKELENSGDIITVHMSDKYGDQGLVSVLILRYDGDGAKNADIDTFLMSCRVMERNVENEIIACVKGILEKKEIQSVRALYVKTSKNAPVAELFDKLGFVLVSRSEVEKRYEAKVCDLPMTTGLFKKVVEDIA